jgi:hypothetical protein
MISDKKWYEKKTSSSWFFLNNATITLFFVSNFII